MREFLVLLSPAVWAMRNDILRFRGAFYRKALLYLASGTFFVLLLTRLMTAGMMRLQHISEEVFGVILMRGFSLIFLMIFLVQIINSIIVTLNTFYQANDLGTLLMSPVNRTALFYSRLVETHFRASWMLVVFCLPLFISSGLIYGAGAFYYICAVLLLGIFSVIPVNAGIVLAIFAARFLNVRKFKRSLVSIGMITLAIVLFILRIFRPERFVNPELFANLTLFLSEMSTPSHILLPNRWLSEILSSALTRSAATEMPIFAALLLLTSYLTSIAAQMAFERFYYSGWELLQEGEVSRMRQVPSSGRRLMEGIRGAGSAFLRRDLLLFLRDPGNLQQSLITISLMTIYLFSISALPLNWEDFAIRLKYITAFFNLGLILIILASICSRFIYPGMRAEAAYIWLIKSVPFAPRQYVITKYIFYLVPAVAAGELLTFISFHFIGTTVTFTALMALTTLLSVSSLVALAIGFGIRDLGKARDSEEGRRASGSAMHMMASVVLIFFTLLVETIPVFLYFLKESKKVEFAAKGWGMLSVAACLIVSVHAVIAYISLKSSIRRIEMAEPL